MEENKKNFICTRSLSNSVQKTIRTTFDTTVWFSKRTDFHFRTGERADSLDKTLFRLPLLALPFSPTSSGRHFAAFPIAIKTPRNYVNCALVYEIILFGMIMRAPSLFLFGVFVRIYRYIFVGNTLVSKRSKISVRF